MGGCPTGKECTLKNTKCFDDAGAETTSKEADDKKGTQKCLCESKFGPNKDNNECVASVGADCLKNIECTLENQDCIVTATKKPAENTADKPADAGTQACECVTGFVAVNGMCVPDIGGACPKGDECKKPGTACNPKTNKCVAAFGGKCEKECELDNQVCEDEKCKCKKGFTVADGKCTEWASNFCAGADAKCGKGDGDCNDDKDCAGDLVCGVNNCPNRPLADCCVDPADPTGQGVGTKCDGTKPNQWGCCTPESKCGEGEGDCDSKADCKEGLECMPDSCGTAGGFANIFPLGQMDCCQKPTTTAGFYQINYYDLYEYWKNDDEQEGQRPKY